MSCSRSTWTPGQTVHGPEGYGGLRANERTNSTVLEPRTPGGSLLLTVFPEVLHQAHFDNEPRELEVVARNLRISLPAFKLTRCSSGSTNSIKMNKVLSVLFVWVWYYWQGVEIMDKTYPRNEESKRGCLNLTHLRVLFSDQAWSVYKVPQWTNYMLTLQVLTHSRFSCSQQYSRVHVKRNSHANIQHANICK